MCQSYSQLRNAYQLVNKSHFFVVANDLTVIPFSSVDLSEPLAAWAFGTCVGLDVGETSVTVVVTIPTGIPEALLSIVEKVPSVTDPFNLSASVLESFPDTMLTR